MKKKLLSLLLCLVILGAVFCPTAALAYDDLKVAIESVPLYTIYDDVTVTVASMLGGYVDHTGSCVQVYAVNCTVGDSSVIEIVADAGGLASVKGLQTGTSTLTMTVSTSGCSVYGTTTVTATINIAVVLSAGNEFVNTYLNGDVENGSPNLWVVATPANAATIIAGSSVYDSLISTEKDKVNAALNEKLSGLTYATLLAQAQKTVTYNANAGSGAPGSQTKILGQPLTLSTTVPSRTGYTFLGWAPTSNVTEAVYAPGDTFESDADTTLYAVWEIETYPVSYDANGGSGEPESQTKTYGINLALSRTEPTQEGYHFTGWYTTANGTGGTAYPAGGTYTANAGAVLFAQWTTDTYTVSYNANGGSGEPSDDTKTYGTPLTLSSTEPTREGFNFVGWAADAAAESAEYAASGSYIENASVTLYAVWQSTSDTVSYNANGGSGAPGSQTKIYGVDLTLSGTEPTRSGYTFLGWATASNGSVAYDAGGIYTDEDSIILYAVWEPATYTVTYRDNVSSEIITVPDSQIKFCDETLILSSMVPTLEGYTFAGWYTTADGEGGTAYAPGASYTANADLSLYAQWIANSYTVTYNANGGSFDGGSNTASATKTQDSPLTLLGGDDAPSRTGFTFIGWATDASAQSPTYEGGDSYTDNESIVLYAVWQVAKFDSSTTLVISPESDVYEGDSICLTATVTRLNDPTQYPAAGTTVTFYCGDIVLGTSLVGANGTATYYTAAIFGTSEYKAVYNGSDEYALSINEDNTASLTVKSVTIQLKSGENTITVTQDSDTVVGPLTTSTTYAMTAPSVYAADDLENPLTIGTQYTVEWWWYNGITWNKVDSDSGNPAQLTITPAAEGQKWYAKILPAGKYTAPVGGISTAQVTCGDLTETATTLSASPTAAYENAVNAVTLTATVTYGDDSAVTEGWVMFKNSSGVQVGYAKLDNQGKAAVTVTLPAYSNSTPTAYYYAEYEGTSANDASSSIADITGVSIRSTTFMTPTITVKSGSTTIGSTTGGSITGLTAGVTYTVSVDVSSLKGLDGTSVTSGDYTLQWQKVSGGNTTIVGTGSSYTFTALNGEAYQLYVEAKGNMKIGSTSDTVSVDNLATPIVTLIPTYTFQGASVVSTAGVDSAARLDGSHVGDSILLTASVEGINTVPTGTVDFFYIPQNGTATKLARVSLTEWDTNEARAEYTISGSTLGAGTYAIYAVYSGSSIYGSTTYNSQYDDNNTVEDDTDDTPDPSVKTYKIWSVTIQDSAAITSSPAAGGDNDNLLTAGTAYTFSMGDIYTTDGEKLALGTDYTINWYVSANGSSTGYGAASYIATEANDRTWTQTPADSNYLYKAVVTPLSGSASAKLPALGVTSNTFSTSTAATTTSVASNVSVIYEGNDIQLTAIVTPTGSTAPTGTVEFYYYTTDAASKTLIGTAEIQSKTTTSGTVYYAELTTDALPDNNGLAQDVYVYAKYMGNSACSISDGTTAAILVKSSVIEQETVLIITANGTFADSDNNISFDGGTLPADGSNTILTLGTVTTLDGNTEPLNENDYIITWEYSNNYTGDAGAATWVTYKTGESVSEVAPTAFTTAYRVKITPKFEEKTVMSDSSYYSNVITAGVASSVTQMSISSSDTPAKAGSTLTFDVKITGGSAAPTGSVTLYQDNSPVAEKELVNGGNAVSFELSDVVAGEYTFKAVYTSTNGYSDSYDQQTYYVCYAPMIELAPQTVIYDGKAHYYSGDITVTGMSEALNASEAASISFFYQDAAGNVSEPVNAGTYTVYAQLPETAQYAAADAIGTMIIEPRTLTVSDFIIQAKTYDGTTAVNVMTVDTNVIHGDSVLMGGTAVLDAAGAGTRTVTYTPAIVGGDDAGNYQLTSSYTVSKETLIARNQLAGAITAEGVITLYKANGSTMQLGTGSDAYKVTYYYHDGNYVKATTDLTKDGKYTVVVQPNSTDNYKGGLSTTMTITDGVKAYAPVTCDKIPVSFTISNTNQIWDGNAKTVTVAPSISGFTGYTVTYNGQGLDPAELDSYSAGNGIDTSNVGIYGVTVTVTDDNYTGSAVGRMQVFLGVETAKATISVANKTYDGTPSAPVVTNEPATNYYITYTGGDIKGVSYDAPKDEGSYVAMLYVESTNTVTAYTASAAFTISKKQINLAADDKTKEQYATNPVWTYTADGLAAGDSTLNFFIQPTMSLVSNGSNDNFDQVGTYTIEIGGAYAKNYSFTYSEGAFSVDSVDPNVPMTIVGIPQGTIRYGDSFRLYTYGTRGTMASDDSTVGYSDSSVICYTVESGNAEISGDILTVTGIGDVTIKVTRGEGQNAVYATESFTAAKKVVTIVPIFGDYTYDGTTAFNATDADITGLVGDGESLSFGDLTEVPEGAAQTAAGQYAMTWAVDGDNAYYTGFGTGLMTIAPKSVTITAESNTTTYGTALAVGANAIGMMASPEGYTKAVTQSDVGSYETFAAGVDYDKNYQVSYETGTQTVTAKALTIQAGSLASTEYGISTTEEISAALFTATGDRIYGGGNQIMDYLVAVLIDGDSLADLYVGNDGIIVSYDKDETSDANRTFEDHDVAISGREADYPITLGTLTATNYDITQESGILNIYQRNVTVSAVPDVIVTKHYDGSTATDVPSGAYLIQNVVNHDALGLTYTAAFDSATQFDLDDVTMTILSLAGDKRDNYYLNMAPATITLTGKVLPVGTDAPTSLTSSTATLNGTLYYDTDASEVGFYLGESTWTAGQMIKIPLTMDVINGETSGFSKLIDATFTSLALSSSKQYKYYAYVNLDGTEYTGETVTFRPTKTTGSVTVTVTTESVTDKTAQISIEAGNLVLATTTATAVSGTPGSAVFSGLKDGVYNVVVHEGNWTATKSITITNGVVTTSVSFEIPVDTDAGSINSHVTVASGGVNVAVNGLSDLFTDEDLALAAAGGSVDIELNVSGTTITTVDGKTATTFDISINKTTTTSDGTITELPLTTLDKIIEIAVPLSASQIANKTPITIYHEHNSATPVAMDRLAERQSSPYTQEGFYVDYSLGYVFIYSSSFSDYSIVEGKTSSVGGGGGSSITTYEITVTSGTGGSVTPGTTSVTAGKDKTFTITADGGYVISDVLVDGQSVGAVSEYTFEDVNEAHTLKAFFTQGDGWDNPFIDVHESDWFYDAVKYVYINGLMNGTSANTFEPNLETTRAMIVTILWRLEGQPEAVAASSFQDVTSGQYYAKAVAWGAENGVVKGYDADTFGPNDNITREQMVAILYRYASYKGYDVTSADDLAAFADATSVSDWALAGTKWAVAEGLINGVTATSLDPTGNATRAQVATILMRFIENIAK